MGHMTTALKSRRLLLGPILAILMAAQACPQQTSASYWQQAAGGKLSFDVASIRPATAATHIQRNVPMGSDDAFQPTGGVFRASFPVSAYIAFAYKLFMTRGQRDAMFAKLPAWTTSDNYAIEARGPADATKDQFRLMMQSLLAERFGLKVHFEERETPVLVMTLIQPGKTGPKLRPHSEGPPCDRPAPVPAPGEVPTVWPLNCDEYALRFDGQHPVMAGSRNTTLDLLALSMSEWSDFELGRTMVNRTGLTGRWDFTLTCGLNLTGALPPDSPALQGPTFLEAMREQLGIKLSPAKLPVQTMVIDHLERPSVN